MEKSDKKTLCCTVCGGENFRKDGVVLAKYGLLRPTDYKADAYICKDCHHVMLFESGVTFFLGVD